MRPEDNEALTRIEGQAPMGRYMRGNFWIPAVRSGRLVAGGAPVRVRLFGEDLVAFRIRDGRVGLLDERCPHRGTSLALARNEDCGLRCIFHGWKIDVAGKVVEVPTEPPERHDEFAASVPVKRYPTEESGGVVWAWMGEGTPAAFRPFGFGHVPESHRFVTCTRVPVNWLQALEATVDSAHIGILHRDWIDRLPDDAQMTVQNLAPAYEIEETAYGMRAAALRPLPDGTTYVRISEYLAPFTSITLPFQPKQAAMQMVVPVDDATTNWWFVQWSLGGPLVRDEKLSEAHNRLDAVIELDGPPDAWGQDREAMDRGSFSGFDRGVLFEDAVVQASMGRIADRSREFLSRSDLSVLRARRLLLEALADQEAGRTPMNADPSVALDDIYATGGVIPTGEPWSAAFPATRRVSGA